MQNGINLGESDFVSIYVYLLDFDKNDQYKEIRVIESYGLEEFDQIYRLTKDGLEYLFDAEDYLNNFMQIGDKIIFTNYFTYTSDNKWITMGYYLYEDGKFNYIDRFSTGEKITDEDGAYTEGFQKLEFGTNATIHDSSTITYKDGQLEGYYNILRKSESVDDNGFTIDCYDIRLTKDSNYTTSKENGDGTYSEVTEILPAGTILEDVEMDFNV